MIRLRRHHRSRLNQNRGPRQLAIVRNPPNAAVAALKGVGSYCAKTLLPLVLGGFLLSAAASEYQANREFRSAFIEGSLAPLRGQADACLALHEELVTVRHQAANGMSVVYLSFAERFGWEMPPGMDERLLDALPAANGSAMQLEWEVVEAKKRKALACYRQFYRMAADAALLLESRARYEEFNKEADALPERWTRREMESLEQVQKEAGVSLDSGTHTQFLLAARVLLQPASDRSLTVAQADAFRAVTKLQSQHATALAKAEQGAFYEMQSKSADTVGWLLAEYVRESRRTVWDYLLPRGLRAKVGTSCHEEGQNKEP